MKRPTDGMLETLLQVVLEHTHSAFVYVGPSQEVEFVSPNFEGYLQDPKQLIGKSESDLLSVLKSIFQDADKLDKFKAKFSKNKSRKIKKVLQDNASKKHIELTLCEVALSKTSGHLWNP